jgi:signal transduction histidine kinase
MTPSAIKLPWSSCRGHLKQESLVLNCLPDGGAYDLILSISENSKIREAIISDIHDGVGARLNVLLLGVEMGNFKPEDLRSEIHQCVDELRFVLAPEEAKVSFLMNLILNFCHEFKAKLEYKNIEFYFLINYKDDSLISPRVALVVYWITLECLSNVIKHAVSSCSRVSYVLNIDAHAVSLLVEDDGPGIRGWRDADQRIMSADARVGLGLKSLINRAKSVGGRVWIASGPKTGTVVSASFETAVSPT